MHLKSLFLSLATVLTMGMASSAHASVMTPVLSSDVPVAICDECSISSTLNFGLKRVVSDIDVMLNLTHGWTEDLVITLSHGGTTVLLANRVGGSGGADYTGTVFDDSAAFAISSGFAEAPYTGSFQPEEALSAFAGMDAFGLWTLTISDMEALDDGMLNSWGMDVHVVPEPGSFALLGLGLLGLAGARRKKK